MKHFTWDDRHDAALVLALIALGFLLLLSSGCVHVERLSYQASAAAEINSQLIGCANRATEAVARMTERGVECEEVEEISAAMKLALKLADSGLKRAQMAELYWGVPKDRTINLFKSQDNHETIAFAGLSSERARGRGRIARWLKARIEAACEFAANLAAATTITVAQAFIPSWVWWWIVLPTALAAIGIGLYALYTRLVVHRQAKTIHVQGRAIDEYDDLGEDIPLAVARRIAAELGEQMPMTEENLVRLIRSERNHIGRDKLWLALEHAPRNDRRKALAQQDPIRLDHQSCTKTHPSARDMLPGLNGNG